MRLVYSPEAIHDLTRIRAFIAENDALAAARIAAELMARIENICRFPSMGVKVSSAPNPAAIRDAIFSPYIVRYSPREDVVVVLRIWHHFEDPSERTGEPL